MLVQLWKKNSFGKQCIYEKKIITYGACTKLYKNIQFAQ